MDNLKAHKENTDTAVPIGGGVASVKTVNLNPHTKGTIDIVGRYTGFPFNSQRTPTAGAVPYGSLFWNGNAMNKNDANFEIWMSQKTVDGNNINRVLETLSAGDLIHFKNFEGRSTTLEFKGFEEALDTGSLVYYKVTVIGFLENTNYAVAVGENEPCMIEFIKNTKILDTRLISYTEPTVVGNVYDFPIGEVARIKGVNYVTDAVTSITVPNAAAGLERIDFIVFGITGIIRVAGVESGTPSSPTLTDEQILLRIIKVDDGGITEDEPTETIIDTTAFHFKGSHNVVTNSPVLSDGVGQIGDVYEIITSGVRDYGSGNITLVSKDYLFYDGSIWKKFINNNQQQILTGSNFGAFSNSLTTENGIADGDFFNYTDITDNEQKKTSWSNIKTVLKTYFDTLYQSILNETVFGALINALSAKATPVDTDNMVIQDSADSNKAKKVSLTNFKAFLKTYFDTLYLVPQITITTAANITVLTQDGSSRGQQGRNVVIDNGASVINIATDTGAESNFCASYLKHGTGAITFVQGAGTTLIQVDGTNVFNGAVGSTATLSRVGNNFYLRISNA